MSSQANGIAKQEVPAFRPFLKSWTEGMPEHVVLTIKEVLTLYPDISGGMIIGQGGHRGRRTAEAGKARREIIRRLAAVASCNQIAGWLNIHHTTVMYHARKLLEELEQPRIAGGQAEYCLFAWGMP